MTSKPKSFWIALIAVIFALLPLLAPVLSALGERQISSFIYSAYQFFCHQRPWRSYHISDYQMAYCAREVGTFTSIAVGALTVHWGKLKPLPMKYVLFILAIGILPFGFDGGFQLVAEIQTYSQNLLLPLYESSSLTRCLTGIFFGSALSISILPILADSTNQTQTYGTVFKLFAKIICASILIVSMINLASFLSSTKYKPENPIFDTTVRLPGYNYEIIEAGGHTPDSSYRLLTEPITKYCERAALYMPQEFQSKCLPSEHGF